MTAHSVSEMLIIIRPSFKEICGDDDACRAALYNHFLFRLARKAAKLEPDKKVDEVIWYASIEEIYQDIDRSWSANKIRKEVDALVASGLLGRQHNSLKRWDRKYQYFIRLEQGEVLRRKCTEHGVSLLKIGLSADVLNFIFLVNALTKEEECIYQKDEMHLPDKEPPSTKDGRAIPKGSAKGSLAEGSIKGSNPATEIRELREHVEEVLDDVTELTDSYSHVNQNSPTTEHGYMNRTFSNALITLEDGIVGKNDCINLSLYFSCLFDFTQAWSEQAIADLARRILPAHVWPEQPNLLQACEQMFDACVKSLFEDSTLRERGQRYSAAFLCFECDPNSPSGLVKQMKDFKERNPNISDPVKEIQLRLLGKPGMIRRAMQEFESKGWWPDYLKTPLVEEPPTIDLAELAGVSEEERLGFQSDHAEAWVAYFRKEIGFPAAYVKPLGSHYAPRGQAVEIGYGAQGGMRFLRIYEPGHWDLIQQSLEADGGFGPVFIAELVAALRPVAQAIAV